MPRVAQRSVRSPMRSPRMPKNGEKSEPTHASAAKATRYWTEPVAVSTYQPRISASISNASDVARSAGHWKRKLATRKGAKAGLRELSRAPSFLPGLARQSRRLRRDGLRGLLGLLLLAVAALLAFGHCGSLGGLAWSARPIIPCSAAHGGRQPG